MPLGRARILPACLAAALAGCGFRDRSSPVSSLELVATGIKGRIEAFDSATARGDIDAAMALYGAAPVLMPPGEPQVAGRDSVRAWLAAHLPGGAPPDHVLAGIQGNIRNFMFAHGESYTARQPPGAEPVVDTGKWVIIFLRDADDSLRAIRHIWNSDRAPAPAAPVGQPGSGAPDR